MKMMYDRGTPAPDEIPNVDLEVMNYHRPVVGTFHSKFMVVDRRLAICQSNNIQDRVNVEFMTHLEGPIVQSFYDLCLISWGLPLTPPLPLLASRPPTLNSILDSEGKIQQGQEEGVQYQFGDNHPHIKVKDLEKSTQQANEFMKIHQHNPEDVAEAERTVDNQQVHDEPTTSATGPVPQGQGNATPDAGETTSSPMPPTGSAINKEDTDVQKSLEDNYSRMKGVTAHLNTNLQPDTVGDVEDDPNAPPFRPHIIHSPHDPVPMAMVNRKPRGTPSPGPVDNPQGAAFLAGFKYATNKIFIQTPTFNATPVVAACLAAVRRGIEVTLYLDIGFNDAGEMLPMQGGTNEQVIAKMYAELDENVKKNLKVYWYTGKDQSRPMNASQKKRNCHVKIMIIDEAVGIQGNGNQDTQSWFHSQEVNVLVDSPLIMREWRAGLDANQNTLARGQVEYDGIWRDQRGQPLKDAAGPQKGGIMGTLNGFKGAIDRVRGTGGF
jgi:phosphatidylserine/phosphatidylglycerophosphate/cardiolipin synthase-like enzyme